MRRRLRRAWSEGDTAVLYSERHDHTKWPDHVARVEATIDVARKAWPDRGGWTIADLSCGDAAIPMALAVSPPTLGAFLERTAVILGDLTPGRLITGPIEDTLSEIAGQVDLFVCCETIEHLDDPDEVLAAIRGRAFRLLLSTPLAEWDSSNPEHYWAWDSVGVQDMLTAAGWDVVKYQPLVHPLASYQIWACS